MRNHNAFGTRVEITRRPIRVEDLRRKLRRDDDLCRYVLVHAARGCCATDTVTLRDVQVCARTRLIWFRRELRAWFVKLGAVWKGNDIEFNTISDIFGRGS